MDIAPQDIIDKEFRVKFRGFDMAEVDTFLEEVAENFFKLTEENTLLHEKIAALRRDLGSARTLPAAPVELPPELGGLLEDLKHDTEAIGTELASLKQDRQTLDSLKRNLEKIIVFMQESDAVAAAGQAEVPPGLAETLEEIKKGSTALTAELAALKEDRLSINALKKNLEEASAALQQVTPTMVSQGRTDVPGSLVKTLADFKKSSEAVGSELAALKQEVAALSKARAETKVELQDMISSLFARLEAKVSALGDIASHPGAGSKAAPGNQERLVAARIIEQHEENFEEDTRLPADEEQEDDDDATALDFLSEDDLLDVDKLRGMFQSVLEDTITDGHNSRGSEDSSADLLFFEDDFLEDQHEPQVTFSLEDNKGDDKPKAKKT
jgi:DivIVA domain-containing protein